MSESSSSKDRSSGGHDGPQGRRPEHTASSFGPIPSSRSDLGKGELKQESSRQRSFKRITMKGDDHVGCVVYYHSIESQDIQLHSIACESELIPESEVYLFLVVLKQGVNVSDRPQLFAY
jgi:hypothetical protein